MVGTDSVPTKRRPRSSFVALLQGAAHSRWNPKGSAPCDPGGKATQYFTVSNFELCVNAVLHACQRCRCQRSRLSPLIVNLSYRSPYASSATCAQPQTECADHLEHCRKLRIAVEFVFANRDRTRCRTRCNVRFLATVGKAGDEPIDFPASFRYKPSSFCGCLR